MAVDDRLLRVLRAFNECDMSTVTEIARYTKISRTAVHRIVAMMSETGYLRRIPGTSSYQITALVKTLSSGYREQSWIGEVGARSITWVQQQVSWPTSLAVPERGKMIIRETTRFRSPLVFDLGWVGMEIPMFKTSLGLIYYAFCGERMQGIIRNLARTDPSPPPSAAQLREIVRRGYATRIGGVQPTTSSISVPILAPGGAIGAICVTYAKNAVTSAHAARDYVPLLRLAASNIMDEYGRKSGTETSLRLPEAD